MKDIENNGQKYTWEDFKKEAIYDSLIQFFSKIEMQKNCSVIFVSRKAYCLYLLFKKKGIVTFKDVKVYTDRLIMKNWEPDRYSGEKALLIDDTISTGNHMWEVCNQIVNRTNYKSIDLHVFLRDETFQMEMFRNRLNNINSENDIEINFSVYEEVLIKEKLRFSAIETLLFHEASIPYFIELPYLAELKIEDGKETVDEKDEIVLTAEQYDVFCRGDSKWKFVKCDQSGYLQNKIENAVFIMKSGSFVNMLPQFIHEFVVRVQITREDNRTVNLVLAPFAIFKSVKFQELEDFFFQIFDNTVYANIMKTERKNLQDRFAEVYCKTIYKAIEYIYSFYIGNKFKDYLENITDKKYGFQTKNNKCCFDNDFLRSVDTIFEDGTRDFFLETFLYKGFTSVDNQFYVGNYVSKYGRVTGDYSGIYYYLWTLFNELRRSTNQFGKNNEAIARFLSIEELQQAVSMSSLEEIENSTVKDTVTACLCAMLEQSKVSNALTFDNDKKIVYRGFKYAENGQTTFDLQEKIFYIAISTYSKKLNSDEYKKNYNLFMLILKQLLLTKNLLGRVISSDVFEIYAEHYRNYNQEYLSRFEFLIENKKPIYVETVEKFVNDLKFETL